MAIKFSIVKFPIAHPAKSLCHNYAEHIYSITADTDCWNGAVVAKGAYAGLDRYEEAAATTVDLKVVDKAANGNYYVEVMSTSKASDAVMVYNVPMIEEEYSEAFKDLHNYYIPAGTEMRCYTLHEGDIWELSEEAFVTTPTVGQAITTITGKKLG